MNSESQSLTGLSKSQPAGSSEIFAAFLKESPGALRAAKSLRPGAEVSIVFTDTPGHWRAYVAPSGEFVFDSQRAADPDFELHIPPGAMQSIASSGAQDLGDLGVTFFEHLAAKDPDRNIRAVVHSGIVRLTRRGWLGLVTQGGSKVVLWMARKGLHGPGAIVSALGRFKG